MATDSNDNVQNTSKYQQYLAKWDGISAVLSSPDVGGTNKALIGLTLVAMPSTAVAKEKSLPYLLAMAVLLALLICWNGKRATKIPVEPRPDGTS